MKIRLNKLQQRRLNAVKERNLLFKQIEKLKAKVNKIDESIWKHVSKSTVTYKAPFKIWLVGITSFEFELACVYDFCEYDGKKGVCYSSIYWFSYERGKEYFNTSSGEWYLSSIEKQYKRISLREAKKLYNKFAETHNLSLRDKEKIEAFLNCK